jgi:hypothetical protein
METQQIMERLQAKMDANQAEMKATAVQNGCLPSKI